MPGRRPVKMPRLFDVFTIEEPIAKGRFAKVFKARQDPFDRIVALKVMEEPLLPGPDFAGRFFREAKAMASLEHPHVTPIYAAGQEGRYFYIAMRYLKDGSLADRVSGDDHAKLPAAVTWLRQAVWAAAAAHRQGIVHRDIKPSNILIDGGIAFLADFGLASMEEASRLTDEKTLLGTPLYMAPEQFRSEGPSAPPQDIFSFGVILYQMATGRHPFNPETMKPDIPLYEACHTLYERVRDSQYSPASQEAAGVPPILDKIVARCLRLDPAERYADASKLLLDLNALQAEVGLPDPGTLGPEGEVSLYSVYEEKAKLKRQDSTMLMKRLSTTAMASQLEGAKTCGRFSLVDEIGHGLNGVVYRAFDPTHNESVALKLLRQDRGYNKKSFPGCLMQAAELEHPGLIKVLELGFDGDEPFIVQELIRGPSLDHLLRVEQTIPLGFSLELARQLASVLAYAHSKGVTHFDVKPPNILLREGAKLLVDGSFRLRTPRIALGDFGLRKLRRRARKHRNRDTAVVGVKGKEIPSEYYAYMSPEQMTGQKTVLDEHTDIYAVGAILYEMLTGAPLHVGQDIKETVNLVARGEVKPLRSVRANIPPTVEALCMRALDRDPKKRPASAAAFAEDLANVMTGRSS